MVTREKERIATGATGGALVAGGGYLRHKGVQEAHELVGKPEPKIGPFKFKDAQLLRAKGIKGVRHARGVYGAGAALGLLGTPALAAAVTNHVPSRRRPEPPKKAWEVWKGDTSTTSRHTFLGSGIQGTKDAVKGRAKNAVEPKPPRAVAVPLGIGGLAGLGGSKLVHSAFDRKAVHSAWRHPSKAVAGVTAGALSYGISNKVLNRVAPEYQVTPSGVRRKKKSIVMPSSKATSYEGRASHGGGGASYRQATVTKMGDASETHIPGQLQVKQIKSRKRNLHLQAAGTATGLAGLGLLVARKAPGLAHHEARIENAAFKTAVAGGGIGALSSISGQKIARRDIKAQQAQIRKAYEIPFFTPKDGKVLPVDVVAKAMWSMV